MVDHFQRLRRGAVAKQPLAAAWLDWLWRQQLGRTSVQVLSEFYVNVTRKLDPGLPQDVAWEDVTALVSEFLYREWRMGALMGATSAEAYAVQCHPGAMSHATAAAARATLAIGVALVQPAEFVRFSTELSARA